MRLLRDYSRPLEQGRLLLLSPFSEKLRRGTIQTAVYRNQVVAALADRVFVAYGAPASKTEQFCREIIQRGKRLYTLRSDANKELIALGAHPLSPGDDMINIFGRH